MQKSRARRVGALLVGLAIVGASACGGDDDAATTEAPSTEAPSTEAPAAGGELEGMRRIYVGTEDRDKFNPAFYYFSGECL